MSSAYGRKPGKLPSVDRGANCAGAPKSSKKIGKSRILVPVLRTSFAEQSATFAASHVKGNPVDEQPQLPLPQKPAGKVGSPSVRWTITFVGGVRVATGLSNKAFAAFSAGP